MLAGILYFALVLRWLGPRGYGTITLALAIVGFATLATGNFEVFLERYAAEFEARGLLGRLRRAIRLTFLVKFGLGLTASVVLILLAPRLARMFENPLLETLVPVLTTFTACDALYSTGRATLYGLQQFRWLSLLAVVFHLAKTVMVALLWGLQQGIPQLAVGMATLTAVQGVLMAAVPAWLLRGARDREGAAPERQRTLWSEMVSYSFPLFGARAAFISSQHLTKVVLGKLVTVTQLGYFSFAFQTIERFVELVQTLPSALLPSLTHLVARDERERLGYVFDQAFRLVQVVACVLSFGLFVFAPEVTRWVGGGLFLEAAPLLRIMALVPMARTAQQPIAMLFQAMGRPGTVLGLAALKLAVEFTGYLVLVPMMAAAGAAWSNLAAVVAAYVTALVLLDRALPAGAGPRASSIRRSLAVMAPFLILAPLADRFLPGGWALLARMALVPFAIWGIFALGLVTGYDLDKVASVPLQASWMRRSRDAAVRLISMLVTRLGPQRA